MKKIILLILLSVFITNGFAQASSDSVAYRLQRKKINAMLASRKQKFGQYDQSLKEHTGIFGLQTKKDIRKSNDILMDIVKTDNDIFGQLKILLDYRTFQQNEVKSQAAETDNSNVSFMNTINTLRAENEKLKHQADLDERERQTKSQTAIAIVVGLIVIILFLLRARFVKKD